VIAKKRREQKELTDQCKEGEKDKEIECVQAKDLWPKIKKKNTKKKKRERERNLAFGNIMTPDERCLNKNTLDLDRKKKSFESQPFLFPSFPLKHPLIVFFLHQPFYLPCHLLLFVKPPFALSVNRS
jgi:hypothetical protein